MTKLNIVIASDSFKGSLSSIEVANSMVRGFDKTQIDFDAKIFSIADGGEGTVEAVTNSLNGKIHEFEVSDIFLNKTTAILGELDKDTCIIETASPCGLDKVKISDLDPYNASSYGLGELLIHSLDNNYKKIYIGLGGSSVNDGGIGLAKALGVKILDENQEEVSHGAKGLGETYSIDISNLDERLNNVEIILLSDVKNKLTGKEGATYIYGPQKGVKEEDLEIIDSWMKNYGQKLSQAVGFDILEIESTGAAGGLGAALIALTNAKVSSGIEEIIKILNIEDAIKSSDLVFTGEGRMDGQSLNGKAPLGISKIAKKYNIPTFAIVGSKTDGYEKVFDFGIDLVLDCIDKPQTIDEAINNASQNIENQAFAALKLFNSLKTKF